MVLYFVVVHSYFSYKTPLTPTDFGELSVSRFYYRIYFVF